MNQSWKAVGGADSSMGGFMAPHEEFLRNIQHYKYNHLLDIGRYRCLMHYILRIDS